MIIGERHVHDGAGHDLGALYDRADLGGVHAEDGALRHVDDGGAHHGAENATVRDGEGATGEILKCDLAVASLGCEVAETSLEVGKSELLAVAKHGHDQTGRGRDGSADVDEIAVHHFVVINDSIDDRLLLKSLDGCLHECAHEAEFDAVLLNEGVLDLLAHIHVVAHVNLVEGSKECVGVLGLLQSARDGLSHLAHLDAGFDASASDLRRSLLRSLLRRCTTLDRLGGRRGRGGGLRSRGGSGLRSGSRSCRGRGRGSLMDGRIINI
mmetsp:Transcript_3050/g.3579  ORF Transcript_3050/g.3579 Transcript_3050/m.3579 type:complete len:268 (-) Transcript_3050:528-1331(-)